MGTSSRTCSSTFSGGILLYVSSNIRASGCTPGKLLSYHSTDLSVDPMVSLVAASVCFAISS